MSFSPQEGKKGSSNVRSLSAACQLKEVRDMKAQLTGGLYNVKILPCCQLCERLIISG